MSSTAHPAILPPAPCHYLLAALRPLAAGLLILQLAVPAAFAQQASGAPQAAPETLAHGHTSIQPPPPDAAAMPASGSNIVTTRSSSKYLTGDAAILQVLDRFTYGPRPGDLARARAMGLNAWFQQQLNPSTIDDSALDARLAAFPAMQMPLDKLMELYPSNKEVKAAMRRDELIPGGEAAHAIYANEEAHYKQKKEKKKDGGDDAQKATAPLPQSDEAILALSPDKRFKAICHLTPPQLQELRESLSKDQRNQLTDGFSPSQIETLAAFSGSRNLVAAEDVQDKLMRDIYSERQLQEVMVDFWLNHFNVYMKKNQEAPYYIAAYERQTIRPYALSTLPQLLMATATSPAMLSYLDNSESVGPHSEYAQSQNRQSGKKAKASGLNENYGRELMELHTIGVNGGYTQQDVTEVAKVFTGWTVSKHDRDGQAMVASFDPSRHEPGDKLVLGHRIKQAGESEGFTVLKLLANSPQCARFISTKLAERFVSDNPSPALIERMASTYIETHGDIRHVLLAMVNSPEFFSQSSYRDKVKTPQDYVISAVRAAGSDVQSASALAKAISDLGMPLYGLQTPNGYSMKNGDWDSTTSLVSRMNFALALATNRVQGVTTNFDALLGQGAASMSPDEKVRVLESRLLHVSVSPRTQQLIFAQTSINPSRQVAELRQVSEVDRGKDPLALHRSDRPEADPGSLDTQASLAAGLIFGSPEFQRR